MTSNGIKEKMGYAGTKPRSAYELSEDELAGLKSSLLSMALEVIQVCESNGIRIALAGGSALGAVRHKGFIPWDDDLDLMMPRSDYDRFCKVFKNTLNDRYELIAPNKGNRYKNRFPKVFKRGTVLKTVGDVDLDLPNGIFLDIFLLENIPQSSLVRLVKGFWCNFLMYASSRAEMYVCDNPILREHMSATKEIRKAYNKTIRIGKILSVIPLRTWFNWIDRAVQYKKTTGLLGLPTGRKHYWGEIFPEEVFLPFSRGTFEGHEVPLPADCDTYLRNLYGDYMQIPPPEKREKHFIVELKL